MLFIWFALKRKQFIFYEQIRKNLYFPEIKNVSNFIPLHVRVVELCYIKNVLHIFWIYLIYRMYYMTLQLPIHLWIHFLCLGVLREELDLGSLRFIKMYIWRLQSGDGHHSFLDYLPSHTYRNIIDDIATLGRDKTSLGPNSCLAPAKICLSEGRYTTRYMIPCKKKFKRGCNFGVIN